MTLLWAGCARGAELYADADTTIRWDNTLRYSLAFRLDQRDAEVVADPNGDDGDRNFAPGLISNRLDLVSILDVTRGDGGIHLSAEGWYDTVYHARTDNASPATYNALSVPNTAFPRATRDLQGRYADLGEAYAFGSFDLGGMPLTLRAGRQTLLWGESLFFAENSIAAAQSPIDGIRDESAPGSYSKQVFLPVTQVALTLQPRPDLTLDAYYQLEWRKDRTPAVGSYFSYYDGFDVGGERLIVSPGRYLTRVKDEHPPSGGQFGVALRASLGDVDLGLYVMRFHAKEPQVWLYPGRAVDYGTGKLGEYRLFYPNDIALYGASFSTYLGASTIAGEISARRNMPLVSRSPLTQYWAPAGAYPASGGVALGDTLHAQLSSTTEFAPQPLWDSADLGVEIAANDVLAVTRNPAALEQSRDRFAFSFRAQFEPRWFEVMPHLDISVPVSLGFNAVGRSSVEDSQYFGSGDLEVGVTAAWRNQWRAGLTLTSYFGSAYRQPFADRDFLLLSVERTF